ncbi:MAG: hypothetical protein QOE03_2049 [Micromonosporaceae bacterium]|nr:hypothetical protein [Micromonosporaceae bacterium]
MSGHVFVDESKDRGYLQVGAALVSGDLVNARRAIRSLILPRQRRLHFKQESDARRGAIIGVILGLGVQIIIYDAASADNEKTARRACLIELVADLAKNAAHRVVIERDDSVMDFDKRLLYREVRAAGVADTLRYDHMRAHEECLLAIPTPWHGAGPRAAGGGPRSRPL